MDRLDVATALAIRERLGARDLARSSAVCREFNALANDDTLWRGLSSRETHALVDADKYYTFYRSVNRALSGRAGRSADMIVREIRSLLERYRN